MLTQTYEFLGSFTLCWSVCSRALRDVNSAQSNVATNWEHESDCLPTGFHAGNTNTTQTNADWKRLRPKHLAHCPLFNTHTWRICHRIHCVICASIENRCCESVKNNSGINIDLNVHCIALISKCPGCDVQRMF